MSEQNPGRKLEGALESSASYYIGVAVMVLIIVGIVGWWVMQ